MCLWQVRIWLIRQPVSYPAAGVTSVDCLQVLLRKLKGTHTRKRHCCSVPAAAVAAAVDTLLPFRVPHRCTRNRRSSRYTGACSSLLLLVVQLQRLAIPA
jgi:hypothetical protein